VNYYRTYEELVNPDGAQFRGNRAGLPGIQFHRIPDAALQQHGVRRFREAAQDMIDTIESTPSEAIFVLGHNINTFDLRFLKYELEVAGLDVPERWLFCDTLPLLKKLAPGRPSYKLGDLCRDYNVTRPTHRAGADAKALWEVLRAVAKHYLPTVEAEEIVCHWCMYDTLPKA
jgi:DNA polymerase III epsilon subunit-like protein